MNSSITSPLAIMFFGVSGSGKGTQAELLAKHLETVDSSRKVVKAEMGSLLREFMKQDNSLAQGIEKIISAGSLVPSFVPAYLLTDFLSKNFTGKEHLILDGVARRPIQSKLDNQMIRFYGKRQRFSIVLELSKKTAHERLHVRGRHDDAEEDAIERRFKWYEEQVIPSIDTLESLGWETHRVNGERDVESIQKDIRKILGL